MQHQRSKPGWRLVSAQTGRLVGTQRVAGGGTCRPRNVQHTRVSACVGVTHRHQVVSEHRQRAAADHLAPHSLSASQTVTGRLILFTPFNTVCMHWKCNQQAKQDNQNRRYALPTNCTEARGFDGKPAGRLVGCWWCNSQLHPHKHACTQGGADPTRTPDSVTTVGSQPTCN